MDNNVKRLNITVQILIFHYFIFRDDLRTFFSHLLIALSFIDSFYLLLCFLEAFRR